MKRRKRNNEKDPGLKQLKLNEIIKCGKSNVIVSKSDNDNSEENVSG